MKWLLQILQLFHITALITFQRVGRDLKMRKLGRERGGERGVGAAKLEWMKLKSGKWKEEDDKACLSGRREGRSDLILQRAARQHLVRRVSWVKWRANANKLKIGA